MAQAGKDITAVLRLNAQPFQDSLTSTTTAVTKFKESMMDLGKNSQALGDGIRNVSRNIKDFISTLGSFKGLSSVVNTFNKFAMGMEHMATAAQRFTRVSKDGSAGIQALNEIITAYATGVSNAEITVKRLVTTQNQSNTTINNTKSSAEQLKYSISDLDKTFLNWANNITQSNTALINQERALAIMKSQYGATASQLERLKTLFASWGAGKSVAELESMGNAILKNNSNLEKLKSEFLQLSNVGTSVFGRINSTLDQSNIPLQKFNATLQQLITQYGAWRNVVNTTASANNQLTTSTNQLNTTLSRTVTSSSGSQRSLQNLSTTSLGTSANVEKLNLTVNQLGNSEKIATVSTEELSTAEKGLSVSSAQASTGLNSTSASAQKGSASMNQMASSSNMLGQALYSLMRIGRLVGIMFGYQIAYQFIHATTETVNARSEMEAYFRMMNMSTSEINKFNQGLDQTVAQFQRVNKYSMGETISSIGMEFNLTNDEMIKAMKVTSMITSEYMRAGRTADEASLAVKDILQGQFQRLSRETGVGKEELMEAGWTGDVKDTMSLLEALEKVGQSRHWDLFAEKASSLNDIVTILQNRFAEWSADMVNYITPTIVNAFNTLMDVGGRIGEVLQGVWSWLNTDGWGQLVVKVTALGGAIIYALNSFVAFRTGASMLQVAQMGLSESIAGVVFGLKAEEMATIGSKNAIIARMLGIKAEAIEEKGLAVAVNETILAKRLSTTEETANTVSRSANTASIHSQMIGLTAESSEEELNALAKQLNTTATVENTTATVGFTGALQLMIAGETLAEGETLSLAGAMGILSGALLTSPITWIVAGFLGFASAVFVLTGGLDECWSQMQRGNEIIANSDEYIKRNQEYLDDLANTVGTTSQRYKDAEESVRNFNGALKSSSYWAKQAQKDYDNIELEMSTSLKGEMRKEGYDSSQLEGIDSDIDTLIRTKDRYYVADQVLHKQIYGEDSNFIRSQRQLNEDWLQVTKDEDEIWQERGENLEYWQEYARASYKANTAESWWDWQGASVGAFIAKQKIEFSEIKPQLMKAVKERNYGEVGGLIVGSIIDGIKERIQGKKLLTEFLNLFWGDDKGTVFMSNASENFSNGFFEGISTSFSKAFDELANYFGTMGTDYANSLHDKGAELIGNFTNGLIEGLKNFPFVNTLLEMFGLTNQANTEANTQGTNIGNVFKNALESTIRNIPIVGDILQVLATIQQVLGSAWQRGWQLANSIKNGVQSAINSISDLVRAEFGDILKIIESFFPDAFAIAQAYAQKLWDGVQSIFDRNSPGVFARMTEAEFGTDLPNAIDSAGATAYDSAQGYAQQVLSGVSDMYNNMPQVSMDLLSNSTVGEYQADANAVATLSATMSSDTTSAFNTMQSDVNSSVGGMATDVNMQYTTMQQKQNSLLTNMQTSNTTAYKQMQLQSNQSLLTMRDQTSNITTQMISAWSHMKTQLVATANALRSESTAHFNTLSNTIGSFYRKIQNPANWGSAGPSSNTISRSPQVGAGRRVASVIKGKGYAGGSSNYDGKTIMSIAQLKKKLCPNGECGDLFDGYESTDVVNVYDFLASVTGNHGFGWSGWNNRHYSHIKNKSDAWNMKSPQLLGRINTDANFRVGDFENGTPKISFGSFQSMAESLFSAIPYRHYYDSSWKGSWLGAIQAGACNCWDGANALLAFANTCGFGGYIAHGSWDGEPHVWAVINGKTMDTTAWQQGYGWSSPKVAGGVPNHRQFGGASDGKTINITLDMKGSVFYGEDDFENKMRDTAKRVMKEEFNDPLTVAL